MTNAFIQMSGVFAELELRIIRERVRSGMRNARAKGARIGRPQTTLDDIPANFLRHYPQYVRSLPFTLLQPQELLFLFVKLFLCDNALIVQFFQRRQLF